MKVKTSITLSEELVAKLDSRVGPSANRSRVFVVVSRQATVDSLFSSVVCAPVYGRYDGLSTPVILI